MISNLKELNNAIDEVDKGTWSEIVCSIGSIKTTGKTFYLACPSCKKKVIDEENGQCNNCSKSYEEACPKYFSTILICDSFDSLWVSAYDDVASVIMGIPASDYAKLSEEEVQ